MRSPRVLGFPMVAAVLGVGAVALLPGYVGGQTKQGSALTDKQRIARLEAQVRRQADEIARLRLAIGDIRTPASYNGNAVAATEYRVSQPDNSASLNAAVSDATRNLSDQRSAVSRLEQSVGRQDQTVSTLQSAVSRLESRLSSLENKVR